MGHMLKYLTERPDKGPPGYETAGFTVIQYWRSFDHLEAFARDDTDPHLAVWRNYWRRVGRSARSRHLAETYLVRDGEYEAIYGNMPAHGLGKATLLIPLSEASSARRRLRSAVRAGSILRAGTRLGAVGDYPFLSHRPSGSRRNEDAGLRTSAVFSASTCDRAGVWWHQGRSWPTNRRVVSCRSLDEFPGARVRVLACAGVDRRHLHLRDRLGGVPQSSCSKITASRAARPTS